MGGMMNTRLTMAVAAAALLLPAGVQAEQGDWLVRVRAVDIVTDSSSSPVTGVAVKDKWIPEVDISYFFTRNLAAELILTYPQKHDVTFNGAPIGSVKHLPPTLTLQYHFIPDGKYRPYVGAGINLTHFSNVKLNVGGSLPLNTERYSFGAAIQGGFDVELTKNLFLNLDVKKVWMDTDLTNASTGAFVTKLNIDPVLVGVGIGWKF